MTIYEVCFGLFLSSFLSATILPGQSEIALMSLIMIDKYSLNLLILFSCIGNILGSILNWFMGFKLEKFKNKKWFPATDLQLKKATHYYNKYGKWTLILCWVPFIGDPITIIAGLLRVPILHFILIVSFAKIIRYLFVAYISLSLI